MKNKILLNAKPIEDKIINNIPYKMRVDVGDFCKDRFEANILRIILLQHGKFKRQRLNNGLNIIIDIITFLFIIQNLKNLLYYLLYLFLFQFAL